MSKTKHIEKSWGNFVLASLYNRIEESLPKSKTKLNLQYLIRANSIDQPINPLITNQSSQITISDCANLRSRQATEAADPTTERESVRASNLGERENGEGGFTKLIEKTATTTMTATAKYTARPIRDFNLGMERPGKSNGGNWERKRKRKEED